MEHLEKAPWWGGIIKSANSYIDHCSTFINLRFVRSMRKSNEYYPRCSSYGLESFSAELQTQSRLQQPVRDAAIILYPFTIWLFVSRDNHGVFVRMIICV